MAEINWNPNLEVSKMKGDRKYRRGGDVAYIPVEKKKKKKKFVTITKKPKGIEKTPTPSPHKSKGKFGPKSTGGGKFHGVDTGYDVKVDVKELKKIVKKTHNKAVETAKKGVTWVSQKAKSAADWAKKAEKKTRVKKKTKKKAAPKYREGGYISYSGTNKTPQSNSKYPGMG